MAWASITYTFSPSTTIRSSEVNQNFSDVVADLDTAMPSGGIIIWSGAVASVPTGWYLCNGSNSTPDLRDRFVVGAGSSYAVGATGGEATHVLTNAELPTDVQNWYGTRNASGSTALGDVADKNVGFKTIGSGSAHENRPPYYALAYIMKS